MKKHLSHTLIAATLALLIAVEISTAAPASKVPRFSVNNMDRSVDPSVDFYKFACGAWLKENPIPADKARWAGFDQLQQRNWDLIRDILESSAKNTSAPKHAPVHEVGDFFVSAMDT